MAYKISQRESLDIASSITPDDPDGYAIGDMLCFLVLAKNTSNAITTATPGWTVSSSAKGTYNNNSLGVIYKSATVDSVSEGGAGETMPLITVGSSVDIYVLAVALGDVPSSSAVDLELHGSTGFTGLTQGIPTGTTGAPNTFGLWLAATSNWAETIPEIGSGPLGSDRNVQGSTQAGVSSGWWFEEDSGVTSPSREFWLLDAVRNRHCIVISFKSDTAAIKPVRCDLDTVAPWELICAFHDNAGYKGYTLKDISADVTALDTISTTSVDSNSDNNLGFGLNLYMPGVRSQSVSTAVGTAYVREMTLGATEDLSAAGTKIFFYVRYGSGTDLTRADILSNHGLMVGLRSGGTGSEQYRFFDAAAFDTFPVAGAMHIVVIDPADITNRVGSDIGGGSFDLSDIRGVCTAFHSASTSVSQIYLDYCGKLNRLQVIGGDDSDPMHYLDWSAAKEQLRDYDQLIEKLGDAYETKISIQIGDGSSVTHFHTNGENFSFPNPADFDAKRIQYQVYDSSHSIVFELDTGSTATFDAVIDFKGGTLDLSDAGNVNATWTFNGGTWKNVGTWNVSDIGAIGNMSIVDSAEMLDLALDLTSGVTLTNTTVHITGATQAALQSKFNEYARCIFNGNASVGLEIEYTGASTTTIALTAPTNIQIDKTTFAAAVAVACTVAVTTNETIGDASVSGSATSLTEVAPTFDLDLTSNVAATFRVFNEAGGAELFSASASTSESWTHGNQTVSITCWAAGYQQQRRTGVDLTNANVPVTFELVDIPSYNASHGLSYTTDLTYDPLTKELDPVTRQEGADINSLLNDAYDAQTALHNSDYPIRMDGAKTAIFLDDAYIKVASLDNWMGAGYEYRDTSDVVQKQAASFKGQGGTWTGNTAEYQTTPGTGQTDARASGIIDEVIVIYTNGGDDLRGGWVWKYQVNGKLQARADIVALFGGNLQPTEYEFNMAEESITAATGDPAVTLTFTDHGASPVTWNGKDFSITIQSNESAETILRELNYNHSLDATYNGESPFNWWDMVLEAGSSYETARGIHEGGTGAAQKGVRVLNGSGDPHPDFIQFQADDGTYFIPDVTSTISGSGMPTAGANINLQIWNATALTAASRLDSTAYSVGDIRLRSTGLGSENTAGLYLRCTTAGTSAGTEPTWDTTPGNTTTDGTAVWTTYAVLYQDGDPASSAYSDTYIDGEEFLAGEQFGYRFAELDAGSTFKIDSNSGFVSSTGFAFAVSVTADASYASAGIDGSTLTGRFSHDVANDEIDLIADTDYSGPDPYAYYCYTLTTSNGMWHLWGSVESAQEGDYKIITANANIFFDETLGVFIKITDASRWYRDDGQRPAKDPTSGGGGIDPGGWRNPVYPISTGSVLTTEQNALLATSATQSTTAATKSTETNKIVKNKNITDSSTSKQKIYDDDDTTVLLEADLFEDEAGATPWTGDAAILRRDKLDTP